MTIPLPPERVRALLGTMTVMPAMSQHDIFTAGHHKPHGLQNGEHQKSGLCWCGKVATHKFAGWECDSCREIRLRMEHRK